MGVQEWSLQTVSTNGPWPHMLRVLQVRPQPMQLMPQTQVAQLQVQIAGAAGAAQTELCRAMRKMHTGPVAGAVASPAASTQMIRSSTGRLGPANCWANFEEKSCWNLCRFVELLLQSRP